GLPFPSLLPSRSSGGYPDPWGTSSPVGTPIHTHTLTHNSLHDLPNGRRPCQNPEAKIQPLCPEGFGCRQFRGSPRICGPLGHPGRGIS
ncbi:hypothetical protein, partial [Thermus scotoductus]|uniref:hypothetical protein n=1 Tax=Thermus scotoductus TaxID=37636 RepID=UPI001C12CAD6